MKYYIKELLISIYVLKDIDAYFNRLTDFGITFSGLVYIILFFLLFSSLFSASYIKNNFTRSIFGLVLFLSAFSFDAYQKITSDFLTYNTYISLLNATGFAGEAFNQYFYPILTSFLTGLLLLIGILLKPSNKIAIPNFIYSAYPVLVLAILSTLLFIRGGDGAKSLPHAYTTLSYSTLALYEAYSNKIGLKKGIEIPREKNSSSYDIVLIIDESISADFLDINSSYGVKTGLKDTYKDIDIINYGYAASITNCSTETNLTLRYGGTRDMYLKIISTMPSIWEYAKNASYKTVYIDSQRTGNKLHNAMTELELKYINTFIQFDDINVLNRDAAAAQKIVELTNNNSKEFIIVNKIGAHFPIHDKFPDKFKKYSPILPRGNFLNISDTGSRVGFSGTPSEWQRYRNSYKNTLLWNVGNFFEIILLKEKLNNAVILYTSDHGQDLHKLSEPGLYTHCSSNPKQDEGIVPLVIIQNSGLNTLDWNLNLTYNKNKSSHYNIFPTLLSLMGYDKNKVTSFYGNALNIKTNDKFTFNTRFHSRLGKKPIWKKIDITKIINPDNIKLK